MADNKSNNRTIFSCFLGAFLMLFQIGVYFVYIPWNIERLQISESELGLGLLVFGISNLISNQISGRYIVPNIGTRNSMVLGLFIIAFCPLILVSAPNYSSFLLAYIPFGIGVGLFHPSAQSQISMIENKTSRIITPLYQAAFSAGSLVGAIAAAFFIKNMSDPRLIFLLLGLILILGSIAIFRLGLVKNLEILEKTPRFKLPKNNILIFGFLLMMNYATMGIILDWSALWLTRDLLAPLFLGGIIIIVFNIGEIVSRLLASKLIKRSSERFVGGYLSIFSGIIDVNVKAAGREKNKTKIGLHTKDQRFRIESTGKVFFDESNITEEEYDLLDINLKLNAEECKQRDVISFTVIISEMKDGMEIDRRGVSTVVHIV